MRKHHVLIKKKNMTPFMADITRTPLMNTRPHFCAAGDDHEVVCGRPSKEILYNHMHSWFYESRACLLFRTHVLACIQSFGDTLTVTKMKRIKTNIKLYFKGYPNFYYWFTCTYTRKLSRAKETQRKQWVDGTTGARWTYPKCILVLKELTIFTRC